jgi:hypothetical protein
MPRDLRLLPRRHVGIEVAQRLIRLGLQADDLFADRDSVSGSLHGAELLDFGLQLGHRLFEVEIAAHCVRTAFCVGRRGLRRSGGNWPLTRPGSSNASRALLQSKARRHRMPARPFGVR